MGAEVTYRGVTVGKVEALRLSGDGVAVDARLDRGTEIPKDTNAVVENRSAVGEQYLDLQPRTSRAPFLAAGDVIPRDRTAFPIRIDQLLQHVDDTVASVPQTPSSPRWTSWPRRSRAAARTSSGSSTRATP